MLNGDGELPAYPVRVACQHLADPQLPNDHQALLRGLGLASGVFYNHSGNLPCFDWEQVGCVGWDGLGSGPFAMMPATSSCAPSQHYDGLALPLGSAVHHSPWAPK